MAVECQNLFLDVHIWSSRDCHAWGGPLSINYQIVSQQIHCYRRSKVTQNYFSSQTMHKIVMAEAILHELHENQLQATTNYFFVSSKESAHIV